MVMNIVNIQALIFLYSFISGALIGLLYDLFRIKRRFIKTSNLIVNIEDIIYWILVVVILLLNAYISNDGEIRGYIIIGTILGVVIYIVALSKVVLTVSDVLIRVVIKIVIGIINVLMYPINIVYKALKVLLRPVRKCLKILLKAVRRVLRILKRIIKRIINMKLTKFNIIIKIFKNILRKI